MPDRADGVLITRPRRAAEATAARVAAVGLRPIVAPLFTIRSLPARLPDDAAAVLLTSGNAIASLPVWARARPIFAVGDATAARIRAAGFPLVHSAAGDAADLAALVHRTLSAGDTGPLLLLTGKGQGATLSDRLRQQRHEVISHEVYETVPVPALPEPAAAALRSGTVTAALFFSAATTRLFARLIVAAQLQTRVRCVDACAISQPAAMALDALPWRRIRIAAQPTQDAMLALLQ